MSRLHWIAAGVLAVLVILTLGAVGVRWDPFRLDQRRLEAARAATAHAEMDAHARALEAETERAQADAAAHRADRIAEVRIVTEHAIQQTQDSPDAQNLLDAERRDRLRAHDLRLLALALEKIDCTSASGHPADC